MFFLPLTAEKTKLCVYRAKAPRKQCLFLNLNLADPKNEAYKLKCWNLLPTERLLANHNKYSVDQSVNKLLHKKTPLIIAMLVFTKPVSSSEVEKL